GTDANHALQIANKDFTVADLTGLRGCHDCLDNLLGQLRAHRDFDARFGYEVNGVPAPGYRLGWPRWRANPLISGPDMPDTPNAVSAARTSSSLNGLMMAVINFMAQSPITSTRCRRSIDNYSMLSPCCEISRPSRS